MAPGQRYATRPGGYTRVVRTRRRYGDNAQMAYLELIDRPGELIEQSRCALDRRMGHNLIIMVLFVALPCPNIATGMKIIRKLGKAV